MTFQTFTPREYIKIDAANAYGLDKWSWDERIKWFDDNAGQYAHRFMEAESPALFYAAIKAWEDVEAGRPTGHLISLDATASGLQILAAMTGDRATAKLCNVVATGHREDAYMILYERIKELVGAGNSIDREDVKQSIMTAFYGSKAVPKRIFGEGHMLNIFNLVMATQAPGAWQINEAYLQLWDNDAYYHDWIMPDNFHVHIPVIKTVKEMVNFLDAPFEVFHKVNEPIKKGRSLGANSNHSVDGLIVREMARRCDYDPKQIERVSQAIAKPADPSSFDLLKNKNSVMAFTLWTHFQNSGYLSARILDYIDDQTIHIVNAKDIIELLDSLPAKPFKVITVHDCFRCHPLYGNDLRKQYNLQLALLARSSMLDFLLTQITKRPIHITKLDDNLEADILNSNYALS